MKFEKIKAGDVLWEVSREKMGNTTVSTVSVTAVYVMEIIDEKLENGAHRRGAMCHWNVKFNPLRFWDVRRLERLRAKKPELVETFCGSHRLKRRGE